MSGSFLPSSIWNTVSTFFGTVYSEVVTCKTAQIYIFCWRKACTPWSMGNPNSSCRRRRVRGTIEGAKLKRTWGGVVAKTPPQKWLSNEKIYFSIKTPKSRAFREFSFWIEFFFVLQSILKMTVFIFWNAYCAFMQRRLHFFRCFYVGGVVAKTPPQPQKSLAASVLWPL